MRTEKEIRSQIKKLAQAPQHTAKPALVEVNAPLALIQVEIDSKIAALKWVFAKTD